MSVPSELQIALTGSRGVLGRSLQKDWAEPNWHCFPGDVRNLQDVQNWIAQPPRLDAVIHMAARVPVALVDADPLTAFKINVEGTLNVLEAIRARPDAESIWIFLGSTSHVYSSSNQPIAETDAISPVTLYGLTKFHAEEWGRVYQNKFKLNVCVGRIFSYSSPLQSKEYFIPSVVEKISSAPEGGALQIPGLFGTRDFLTTDQISHAVRFLFSLRATGAFNIASGKAHTLFDIAKAVQRHLKRDDVQIEALAAGTSHLNANVQKLRDLGLQLQFNLDGLISQILEGRSRD
ncbi:MAG: putative dependent epimerase/dehydratase [Verrucomicrobiales bacterium]|nr:putative dependent epimerase/dehydratase [Verrucomicrobiales bacterium]